MGRVVHPCKKAHLRGKSCAQFSLESELGSVDGKLQPLDGEDGEEEEGELVDDEACFIDARQSQGSVCVF